MVSSTATGSVASACAARAGYRVTYRKTDPSNGKIPIADSRRSTPQETGRAIRPGKKRAPGEVNWCELCLTGCKNLIQKGRSIKGSVGNHRRFFCRDFHHLDNVGDDVARIPR